MMSKDGSRFISKLMRTAHPSLYWFEKHGPEFFYYYIKARCFLRQKPSLMHFIYITNTNCTLACKECHSWMPYYRHHHIENFDNFKIVMDKLLQAVDLIYCLRFQGGETLMVKELDRMVAYACAQKQICYVQVITNGTLLPSRELLTALRHPKALLSISDYSHIPRISDKLKTEAIKRLCREREIQCAHFITPPGATWIARYSIRAPFEPTDVEKSRINYEACWCVGGDPRQTLLFNGKIYLCPPAFYQHFNDPGFYLAPEEVINVKDSNPQEITRAIARFLSLEHFNLCSRCNAMELRGVRHVPGEQL